LFSELLDLPEEAAQRDLPHYTVFPTWFAQMLLVCVSYCVCRERIGYVSIGMTGVDRNRFTYAIGALNITAFVDVETL